MCTVLLPPGDNPILVNKYIISYHMSSVVDRNVITWCMTVFYAAIILTCTCVSVCSCCYGNSKSVISGSISAFGGVL